MTYEDILFDVNAMIRNSIADPVKLRWINQGERQLYRELPMDESIHPFTTVVGQQVYEVPAECQIDNISSVIVGGIECLRDDVHSSRFWSSAAGLFILHPVPNEEQSGIITYKPTPSIPEDLKTSPSLPQDVCQLLVFNCAAKVALAEGDGSKAALFEEQYQRIFQVLKRALSLNTVFPDFKVI